MGNYVPCLQSKRKDADLICTMEKHCLVTVGATVGFPNLTRAALEPSFWGHLASRGFTSLRIQCGPDIDWATSDLDSKRSQVPQQLNVDVFKLSKNLMREEMTLCKPVEGKRGVGLIISHAGTGTILDAWKLAVPIIVVPNTSLLDDHQTELARHLSKEGYAIHSSTKLDHLKDAVDKIDLLREENETRWPPHSPDRGATEQPVSIWNIEVVEAHKEEASQLAQG